MRKATLNEEGLLKKSAGMRIGLVFAAIAVSLIVSLIVPLEIQTILIREAGPIEWLTVALYVVALGYILIKGVYQPLKWLFWLTVILMLRELDFDSRFTNAKITKSGFLLGVDVPILQKIYGFTLLVFVALVLWKVVTTHAAAFWRELLEGTDLALAVLLAVLAAGLSKLVDGGRRKLGYIGVELTEQHVTGLQLFEEILELSIPLLIMVAISFFLRRFRRGEWR